MLASSGGVWHRALRSALLPQLARPPRVWLAGLPDGAWTAARALATGPPRGTAVGTQVDDVKQVIAVASGKGGVGKSTTAGACFVNRSPPKQTLTW
jgi:Mrp family chromosome partitioning ATPase